MAAPKVKRKSFRRHYRDQTKILLKLAGSLPDRPTPAQVHDLRVTVRRIQVMRRLLPKKTRASPGSRSFGLALKSVMKATSQLRDLDTLQDTLEAHRSLLSADLLVGLENQRSDMAVRAKAATRLIAKEPAPDLSSLRIWGKEVSRRLRRRIRRQGRIAAELLPKVLKDESKITELHALRKDVKKLRYLMELADKRPSEVSVMTRWQESLGAIHDLDVAVAYLEGKGIERGSRAVRDIRRLRHSNYLKFVREYRRDSFDNPELCLRAVKDLH